MAHALRLRRAAPGLFAVLSAWARVLYGKSLAELTEDELEDLLERIMPEKADVVARVLRRPPVLRRRVGGSVSKTARLLLVA
jgi:hypothetical protein